MTIPQFGLNQKKARVGVNVGAEFSASWGVSGEGKRFGGHRPVESVHTSKNCRYTPHRDRSSAMGNRCKGEPSGRTKWEREFKRKPLGEVMFSEVVRLKKQKVNLGHLEKTTKKGVEKK